jgi:hypothetical protein
VVDCAYHTFIEPDLLNVQAVEQFHLLFLTQLGARFDKKLYALKGGCNLRFFWKSIRYSEGMDLDVREPARINSCRISQNFSPGRVTPTLAARGCRRGQAISA